MASMSRETHIKDVTTVLQTLAPKDHKASKNNLQLYQSKVLYLGHHPSCGRLSLNDIS